MPVSSNRFLKQLGRSPKDSTGKSSDNYSSNRFLKQIKPTDVEEEEIEEPLVSKGVKYLGTSIKEQAKNTPRNLMQGALGAGEAALLLSPAGIPLMLADPVLAGATEGAILEEEAWRRELPESLRKELDLPEFKPEIAREVAAKAKKKLLNDKTVLGAIVELPFRLAGVDTKPQTPTEQAIKNFSEILKFSGGAKGFTQLVYQELPSATKGFFKDKLGQLERMLIGGEELPKSIFETAEKVAQTLAEKQPGKALIEAPQKATRTTEEALAGRVTENGSRLRAVSPEMKQTLEPVGQSLSPKRFKNDKVGGDSLRIIIQNQAQQGREAVREGYQIAENEYRAVSDVYPELTDKIEKMRTKLLESGSLNPAEKAVVSDLDNIIDLIGSPDALKKVPVSRLIRTSDSISGRLTQEDIYGDAKTLLRGVARDLNEAAAQAVEKAGGDVSSIKNADKIYSQWADTFANNEISPYLTKRTLNPEGEYSKAVSDRPTYRAVKNAVGKTPEGNAALSALERDLVESELESFIRDPKKIDSPEYQRTIDSLEPLLGEERVRQIDSKLRETRSRTAERRLPKRKIEMRSKPSASQTVAAKYTGKKPEDIQKMLNSRSGIRELRQDLISKNGAEGERLFDQLTKQHIRNMLRAGGIDRAITGDKLYNILNNAQNFEIFSEIAGKEATEAARAAAKDFSKKKMSLNALKTAGKYTAAYHFIKRILPAIHKPYGQSE